MAMSIAALYDMKLRPELKEVMIYEPPAPHEPVGTSFMHPSTADDLAKRTATMMAWASYSDDKLGRTADSLNSSTVAMAARTSSGSGRDFDRFYQAKMADASILSEKYL